MTPGTVLFDRNFRFYDGATGEKLFVIINDGRDGAFIAVKTTSNGSRYGIVYGCEITGRFPHFYLPSGSCCLNGQSWLCLDEFYEFDSDELYRRLVDEELHRIGVLPDEITMQLLACATNCDDISEAHSRVIKVMWDEMKAAAKKP